ncbi:hypothetical protein HYN59_07530 [Flavobacterium album]|uniref:TonB C-terminal domain-containing protein n=1 Tax=Flavobacterium album TaxID=2175091 RepID=A0A2S1QX66_9FLAO|nr:hypothetical protein [Flavobacterium album]AWH84983.1 hypothetical protein HYN59_07530 [Flavobacterium album]
MMKIYLFLLLLCLKGFAQVERKVLTQAVLPECKNDFNPKLCSEQKLVDLLSSTITNEAISDLPESNKDYFSLSAFFVTGRDGKVIPGHTEVRSESIKLKEEIKLYINSKLPNVTPKDLKFKEQRSTHLVNLTFFRNPETGNYYIAYPSEIKEKKINPDYITYDNPALFPGCVSEGLSIAEQLECTQKKTLQNIQKKYSQPVKIPLYMEITVIVDSDGHISVDKIMGSSPDEYEKEVYRVINSFPNIQPAMIHGIATSTSFGVGRLIFK